jgi:adenylate cyclase
LLPGLAEHAAAIGHTLALPDPDGVVRRAPLFARVGDRAVPALGVAIAATFMKAGPGRIPVDGQGRALVGFAPAGLKVVPLADVWTALEERRAETLQNLVDDRIVLLLVEPAARQERTPLGPMSEVMIQAHLLNAVLTRSWPRETPIAWTALGAAVLAGLTAWLWLALRWWRASLAVAALVLGYLASVPISTSLGGLLLRLVTPLVAALVSSAALAWNHFASAHRIGRLEGEIAAIRQALVRQESSVDSLERAGTRRPRQRHGGAGAATAARLRHAGDGAGARVGQEHRDPAAQGAWVSRAGRVRRRLGEGRTGPGR